MGRRRNVGLKDVLTNQAYQCLNSYGQRTPRHQQWPKFTYILYAMCSLEHSKFESFERADFTYSKVGDHSLIASVLTPKKVQKEAQRQVPLLVFWHGGGFVIGDRLYEPWWSDWSVTMLQSLTFVTALILPKVNRICPFKGCPSSRARLSPDTRSHWSRYSRRHGSILGLASHFSTIVRAVELMEGSARHHTHPLHWSKYGWLPGRPISSHTSRIEHQGSRFSIRPT